MNTDSKTTNVVTPTGKSSSPEAVVTLPRTLSEKINAADTTGVQFDIKKIVSESNSVERKNISAVPPIPTPHKSRRSFSENMRSAFDEWWGKVTTKKVILPEEKIATANPQKNDAPVPSAKSEVNNDEAYTLPTSPQIHVGLEKVRTFKEDLARAQNKIHTTTPNPIPAPTPTTVTNTAPQVTSSEKETPKLSNLLPELKPENSLLIIDVPVPTPESTVSLKEKVLLKVPLRETSQITKPVSVPKNSVADLPVSLAAQRVAKQSLSQKEEGARHSLMENLHLAFMEWWGTMQKRFNLPTTEIHQPTPPVLEKKFDIEKSTSAKTLADEILPLRKEFHKTNTEPIQNSVPTRGAYTATAKAVPTAHNESTWTHTFPDIKTQTITEQKPVTVDLPTLKATVQQPPEFTPPLPQTTLPPTPPEEARVVVSQRSMSEYASATPFSRDSDPAITPISNASTYVQPVPQTEEAFVPPVVIENSPTVTLPDPVIITSFHSTTPSPAVEQRTQSREEPSKIISTPVSVSRNVIPYIPALLLNRLGYACIIFVCVVFITHQYNVLTKVDTVNPEDMPIIIPKIFRTDTQTEFPLSYERKLFLTDLSSKIKNAPRGVSQFYPVVLTPTERHSATAQEIFSVLDTHLGEKAINALDDALVIGSITTSQNEPFLVMQSFNFDMLFSSFLLWEPYLQKDMSPLLGTTTTSQNFTDAILSNKPIRILKDNLGNEVLVYAFVNQNTVVITTSRDALLKIFERI